MKIKKENDENKCYPSLRTHRSSPWRRSMLAQAQCGCWWTVQLAGQGTAERKGITFEGSGIPMWCINDMYEWHVWVTCSSQWGLKAFVRIKKMFITMAGDTWDPVGSEMVGMAIWKHGYDKRKVKTVYHNRVFIWSFPPFPPFRVPPFPTQLEIVFCHLCPSNIYPVYRNYCVCS